MAAALALVDAALALEVEAEWASITDDTHEADDAVGVAEHAASNALTSAGTEPCATAAERRAESERGAAMALADRTSSDSESVRQ